MLRSRIEEAKDKVERGYDDGRHREVKREQVKKILNVEETGAQSNTHNKLLKTKM